MKLDALESPKLHSLSARLSVSRPTAIGHLELLWAFTGKHAPQGNIGKWDNGAIARACDWLGDPDVFIDALVESRFVDLDESFRLTVHDWSDHAPGWVRAKLKKVGLTFVGSSGASLEGTSDTSSETSLEDDPEASSEASILVKCSEVKGSVDPPPARKRRKRPKTPIPDDFGLTEDLRAYARDHLPGVDPDALFESFRGKALAKAWEYANWTQALQEYIRNCAPNSGHWAAGQYPRGAQTQWQ